MKIVSLIFFLVFTLECFAETVSYVSVGIGEGILHHKSSDNGLMIEAGITAGVRKDEKYLVEIAGVSGFELDIDGGSYSLDQIQFLVGYILPSVSRSILIQKIGISRWELDNDNRTTKGYAPVYMLEWEKRSKYHSFGINTNFTLADFGGMVSSQFVFKARF